MARDVSSWFIDQTNAKMSEPVRQFTIGSSDYSSKVTRWPRFKRAWNDIRPKNLTIELDNVNQDMNFFNDDKTKLDSDYVVKMGFDRRNLFRHSQATNFAGWNSTFAVTVGDQYTAPDSTLTGDELRDTTDNNVHRISQTVNSLDTGEKYSVSGYFKADVYEKIGIEINNAGAYTNGVTICTFDLLSGGIESVGSWTNVAINSAENGWYRASATALDTDAEGAGVVRFYLVNSLGATSFSGAVGGEGLGTWGLQFEKSTVATSYVVTTSDSGQELITMFSGRGHSVKYNRGKIDITIVDKFQKLADRVVGTSDIPISYTGSDYLPSDIAWWVVTSYAGLDVTTSTDNVDIDWNSFSEWSSVFSNNSVFVEAEFDGMTANEVLRTVARNTLSAVFVQDNKINFYRYSLIDSGTTPFDNSNIVDNSMDIIVDGVINRQKMGGDYAVGSDFFQWTVEAADSASVNSFGIREHLEEDENFWYVNSASALDFAQRTVSVYGLPYERVEIQTGLTGLHRYIGETATVVDSHLNLNEAFRIMDMDLDMNTGRIIIGADKTQVLNAFILDASTLDGPDTIT